MGRNKASLWRLSLRRALCTSKPLFFVFRDSPFAIPDKLICSRCRCSRKKRFSGNDFLAMHAQHVHAWEHRPRVVPTNGPRYVAREYREYLSWLHRNTRIQVHPPASSIPIAELESDDEDPYDVITRTGVQPERAPLENYVVSTTLETLSFSHSCQFSYMCVLVMIIQ